MRNISNSNGNYRLRCSRAAEHSNFFEQARQEKGAADAADAADFSDFHFASLALMKKNARRGQHFLYEHGYWKPWIVVLLDHGQWKLWNFVLLIRDWWKLWNFPVTVVSRQARVLMYHRPFAQRVLKNNSKLFTKQFIEKTHVQSDRFHIPENVGCHAQSRFRNDQIGNRSWNLLHEDLNVIENSLTLLTTFQDHLVEIVC